jgi:acetyl esterase/lipase
MGKKLMLLITLLALVLTACAEETPPPTPVPTATPDPLTLDATPKPVDIEIPDQVTLKGTYYPQIKKPPAPAILLLHMQGRDRTSWHNFALAAQEAGYVVLALDLRGQGESPGVVDFNLMIHDVEVTLNWLAQRPEVDKSRLGVAGASAGANLALYGAANNEHVKSVVMLSPWLDYRGLIAVDALAKYGQRAVMLVASELDATATDAARTLNSRSLGEHRLQIYPGSADHGTDILQIQAGLQPMLVAWFDLTL